MSECKECKGTGKAYPKYKTFSNPKMLPDICLNCNGTGESKVDTDKFCPKCKAPLFADDDCDCKVELIKDREAQKDYCHCDECQKKDEVLDKIYSAQKDKGLEDRLSKIALACNGTFNVKFNLERLLKFINSEFTNREAQARKDVLKSLSDVYNRFKHLDKLLSDTSLLSQSDDPIYKTCYEFWMVIKSVKESEVSNGKEK